MDFWWTLLAIFMLFDIGRSTGRAEQKAEDERDAEDREYDQD